jgi:glycosyltransferase involved in cell wall biosynthesis
MHILLIHQAFVAIDEPGGTRHHELARFLVKRGHKVTIIASPISYLTGQLHVAAAQNQLDPDESGITILRAYTYAALHRSFVHRVISFLSFMLSSFWIGMKVRGVDLVWGTSPPIFQGATSWALARLKRKPFLFEIRDLWPAFAIEVGVLRNPFLIRLSLWLERFLYRHADRVIVNSPGFVDHVREMGARNVLVVPNGVDASMFDPYLTGLDFRQEYGLQGRFIAMYAGAHGMSNDLRILLEAGSILRTHPEIAIVLLGDGKEKPALQAYASELGLNNIFFLPPVPKLKMSKALAASDACIAILKPISIYATVYPNKVFDYMAAGRPVVLAITGVIRDVVEQAGCGICVQPGDPVGLAEAVKSLADDRERAQQMGLRGRDYVEKNFDRKELAEMLSSIIEKMGEKPILR